MTDTKLRSLRPRDTIYRVADANGLAIEVRPTGLRVWRYRYRWNGAPSMVTLGEYPAVSLQEARRRRDEARATLKAGISPSHAARAKRDARIEMSKNTFAAIAAEFSSIRSSSVSSGSRKRELRLIQKDLSPTLGNLPIADLTSKVVLATLRRIEERGAIETANRARALVSQICRFAIATGRLEHNPADNLRGALKTPITRHFASITEPEQVARLLRSIYGYRGTHAVATAMKLAPMLFVRPGELRSMRWRDVDIDRREWRFKLSKTHAPHVVPLPIQAIQLLSDLRLLTGRGEFAFPSARSTRRSISENTLNAVLRTLGYAKEQMTAHGFRAMARTMLDEVLNFRPDYIEHQLGHAVRDPLGRAYNRTAFLVERKAMMQTWADYLDEIRLGVGAANPETTRPDAKQEDARSR